MGKLKPFLLFNESAKMCVSSVGGLIRSGGASQQKNEF